MTAYEEILSFVLNLEIVDTHEHLPPRESIRPDNDVLREYLLHYFSCDLISAGMSPADLDACRGTDLPFMKRWSMLEPFWNAARNTGYGQCLEIAAKELYGIEKITRDTIEELNDRFLKSLVPGYFDKILKQKAKIKVSLLDDGKGRSACDTRYFAPVFRLDSYRGIEKRNLLARVRRESGIPIVCFDDWLAATEKEMDRALADGCVALKIGDAYVRSLYYPRVSRKEAEEEFNAFYGNIHNDNGSLRETFQNYMTHYVLNYANGKNLPVQIHTGLQEGYGNYLANSNPLLLNNLFYEYPDVVFDIFHMGFPFEHTLCALAKNFSNVNIDMCWAHAISPRASVNALLDFLDSVPANKISAFGGDYLFVDGVFAHSLMARRNVSRALSIKVEDGSFDTDTAKEIAEMLLVKNPERIFKLKEKHYDKAR